MESGVGTSTRDLNVMVRRETRTASVPTPTVDGAYVVQLSPDATIVVVLDGAIGFRLREILGEVESRSLTLSACRR
jgi:environmental stress-induced protein Ves